MVGITFCNILFQYFVCIILNMPRKPGIPVKQDIFDKPHEYLVNNTCVTVLAPGKF